MSQNVPARLLFAAILGWVAVGCDHARSASPVSMDVPSDPNAADPPAPTGTSTTPSMAVPSTRQAGSAGKPAQDQGMGEEVPVQDSSVARAEQPEGPPLLERPGTIDYACTLSRPPTALAGDSAAWVVGSGPVAVGDAAHLLRAVPNVAGATRATVVWSSIGMDGMLGASSSLFEAPDNMFVGRGPFAVAGPDRVSLWFGLMDNGNFSGSVPFLQVDATGAAVGGARAFPILDVPSDRDLVRTSDGFVLAWAGQVDPVDHAIPLQLAFLDADGAEASARVMPVKFAPGTGQGFLSVEHLIVTSAGLALGYARNDGTEQFAAYQALDARGEPLGQAVELPTPGAVTGVDLLARGAEVLVAWTAWEKGYGTSVDDQTSVLRVARFGADGARIGPIYDLRAPIAGYDDQTPRWVDLGTDVALLWSRSESSAEIRDCTADCVASMTIEHVVLDGTDLTPRSAVLEIAAAAGIQLTNPRSLHRGDDLLVLMDAYGTSPGPMSATIRCPR